MYYYLLILIFFPLVDTYPGSTQFPSTSGKWSPAASFQKGSLQTRVTCRPTGREELNAQSSEIFWKIFFFFGAIILSFKIHIG
jgi:hypothetical protein